MIVFVWISREVMIMINPRMATGGGGVITMSVSDHGEVSEMECFDIGPWAASVSDIIGRARHNGNGISGWAQTGPHQLAIRIHQCMAAARCLTTRQASPLRRIVVFEHKLFSFIMYHATVAGKFSNDRPNSQEWKVSKHMWKIPSLHAGTWHRLIHWTHQAAVCAVFLNILCADLLFTWPGAAGNCSHSRPWLSTPWPWPLCYASLSPGGNLPLLPWRWWVKCLPRYHGGGG